MNVGVVTSTSPLMVVTDGSTTPIPARRIDTYAPLRGDRVVLTTLGSEVLIFGRIA